LITLLFALPLAAAWPDGAPCIPTTFESMNPLEAVEHQGGLQLSEPPYEIETEQRCYWRGQPIAFTLQGKNESIWFKGFAIQPLEFVNGRNGKRVGRLLRLDDNGSWQYQCFRFHDSATHSHNQRKKHMKIWWRNDDDESRTVQFVATVVHSQKRFWVKSVYSRPIPPCRQQRDFGPYTAPMPVSPPPVKGFKMEADREFGNFFINEAGPAERGDGFPTVNNNPSPSFAANFQQQQESERQRQIERQRSEQRQREMERDRLNRERERARAEDEREARERQRIQQEREQERARAEDERRARIQAERVRIEQQEARQRQQAQQRVQQQQQQQQRQEQPRQRNQGSFRPSPQFTTSFTQQPQTVATIAPTRQPFVSNNNGVCADIDPPSRCIPWSQYCQASTYMHQYCRRTCHFC
ncbi:hypothetical protein PENTCL1PPCAC_3246, partial [Pristionchus entomophagus]